ncbi:MAG: hypothetical protein AB8B59_06120 [Maribacter sp.]
MCSKTLFSISVLAILMLLISCNESEYSKVVKKEMGKGIINDSLLFGLKLGDTQKEFYNKCWKLNKDGVIMQGPKNSFVQYDLPTKKNDTTAQNIRMLFYGIFDEKKIMTGLDMKFSYEAWALWNKSLQADKLALALQDTLVSWFPGNKFIEVPLEKVPGQTFIKVDGNRRIMIEPLKDNKEVDVRIDDLRYILD